MLRSDGTVILRKDGQLWGKTGAKVDPRRPETIKHFNLPNTKRMASKLNQRFLDQLYACKDEDSQRLILGLGCAFGPGESRPEAVLMDGAGRWRLFLEQEVTAPLPSQLSDAGGRRG